MPLQFNEYYQGQTGLTVGIRRLLFSRHTDYQVVEVYETDSWGNLLAIDGMVMLSEKDEFVYHEMLAHVGAFTHSLPKRVLVIGGGDGGTAREVLKHPSVEKVDLVEIDKTVVDASKQFLPDVGDFDNPKLDVIYEDGLTFVKKVRTLYDFIIIDGTDPQGPASGLFEQSFHRDCHDALSESGVLTVQTESPWIPSYHSYIRKVHRSLDKLFKHTDIYLSFIPLYPSGMWSMMSASKADSPLDDVTLARVNEGLKEIEGLSYYNREIHQAAFALPEFVKRIID